MNEKSLPTIRDVAKLAGVSVGSVSRVLNGKSSVTAEVRAKVDRAIRELAYAPNAVAQSMRNHASRTVGCIIRDINIPGLATLVRAAHDVFLEDGYALLLAGSGGRPQLERDLVSVMAARKVDALLLCHHSDFDDELNDHIRRTGIPVVSIDRESPAWADAVQVDHRDGIRGATARLIELGHRRIALLTGTRDLYPSRERIAGWEEAHRQAGLAADAALVRSGSFEQEFGFEQAVKLLAGPDRPTALIAGGILMLPGVIRAIRMMSLRIPEDVSLVGALQSDLADLHQPPISVERWDYAEVGRLAARFALERIRSGPTDTVRRARVRADFYLRESCAAPSAPQVVA